MATNNITITVNQTTTASDGSSTSTTATVEIPLGGATETLAVADVKDPNIITTEGELPTPAPLSLPLSLRLCPSLPASVRLCQSLSLVDLRRDCCCVLTRPRRNYRAGCRARRVRAGQGVHLRRRSCHGRRTHGPRTHVQPAGQGRAGCCECPSTCPSSLSLLLSLSLSLSLCLARALFCRRPGPGIDRDGAIGAAHNGTCVSACRGRPRGSTPKA